VAASKQSHILDEILSQKSEVQSDQEVTSQDQGDSSSEESDDERDERELMQALKHMIRLQVEEHALALLEKEPQLKHISEEVKKESEQRARELQALEDRYHSDSDNEEAKEDQSDFVEVAKKSNLILLDSYASLSNDPAGKPKIARPLNQSAYGMGRLSSLKSSFVGFVQSKMKQKEP
jgi:hypothetical protein